MKNGIFLLVLSFLLYAFNGKNDDHRTAKLFKIERNMDKNEICYDVNSDAKNKLIKENPISVYWVKHTEGGQKEPLTWVQRNFAYGLTIINSTEEEALFQFVSYNKRTFSLKRNKGGVFKVYTTLNNTHVEVKRIYVQIDGGSFWFPKIRQVELHTQDILTGQLKTEIVRP